MTRWLARRLPPGFFRGAWWILQLVLSAMVVGAWVDAASQRDGSGVGSAVLFTVLIGIPVALEWRHVREVSDSQPGRGGPVQGRGCGSRPSVSAGVASTSSTVAWPSSGATTPTPPC